MNCFIVLRPALVAACCILISVGCADRRPDIDRAETIAPDAVEAWRAGGYEPSRAEATEHRLTDLRPIEVGKQPADDPLTPFAAVAVAVTVAQDGRVQEAKVVRDRPGYTTELLSGPSARQALVQARALRFEPFVRDARPVEARMVILVPLVEAAARPPESKSFPEGDVSGSRIVLRRTQCFGSCPAYSVTILGTGEVIWRGEAYVAVKGEARDRIDPTAVAALLDRARKVGFFDLKDAYVEEITDAPTYTVSISHGGRTKTVEDYEGRLTGMPYEMTSLEEAIDRTARTAKWIGADQSPR